MNEPEWFLELQLIIHRDYIDDTEIDIDAKNIEITEPEFRACIAEALLTYYGKLDGLGDMKFIGFHKTRKRAIIRVGEYYLSRIRMAIALVEKYNNIKCRFQITDISGLPIPLSDED